MNSSVKLPGLTQSGYGEVYSYSDMLYALNVTGVLGVAASHPVVILEMGYDNSAFDPVNEATWFNATLSILDQRGIGYGAFTLPPAVLALQRWSLLQTGPGANNYWAGSSAVNYTLNAGGEILVNHMGGIKYSAWKEGMPIPTQSPTPAPTTDGISNDSMIIIALIVVVVVLFIAVISLLLFKTKKRL